MICYSVCFGCTVMWYSLLCWEKPCDVRTVTCVCAVPVVLQNREPGGLRLQNAG